MQYNAGTVDEYISQLPEERQAVIEQLRRCILDNLPDGFEEGISYGMIGYHVPHSLYPAGYHCDPKQPLPFLGLASQKQAISFYHMGIYADPALLDWFKKEYPLRSKARLDMGKSCIRFKKPEHIPYDLLAELVQKVTPTQWIKVYETSLKR
jgi:uncharacterized protein YdhG (YjbR/CyaY superfamily)